jgi:uncharacterized protein YgiM (DUF1202 family)
MKIAAATTIAILLIAVPPARAIDGLCMEVASSDGTANIRHGETDEVVAVANNGSFVEVGLKPASSSGRYNLIFAPHLGIHQKMLKLVSDDYCQYNSISDRDGTANLRKSPNGEIMRAVRSGTQVIIIGRSGEWIKVMLRNGQSGFIHSSRVIAN